MSPPVLDASALLTLLRNEPGAERVRAAIDGAVMSVVNLAEVVSHYAKLGAERAAIEAMLHPLPVKWEPVDAELSYLAGMMRPITLPRGLSLGDRFCLALAARHGVAALTADRRWLDIAGAAGVEVELIR
ncbi:MAG: type II toxin-antitoxin system VapC family toxin [Caulobacteraceae bacterium]